MAALNSATQSAAVNNPPLPLQALFKSATNSQIPLRQSSNMRSTSQQIAQQYVITHSKDWWSIVSEFVLIGGSLAALGYMFKSLINQQNDPDKNKKVMAEQIKRVLLKKMKKTGRKITNFNTNTYEDSLLDLIVLPNTIDVKFIDIGGLDHIKSDLTETVLVPLIYPQLTGSSKLCAPPLGVLFHGPPGTGKSMMAKAIARETNASFFNVDMSRLMSKWYGDSQKYISALFSLARKMAPSIIWIDEIDALFSQRSRNDHSADVYNKALFLSLWDGLASDIYKSRNRSNIHGVGVDDSSQVIILGASNRPQQVDEAFLRRMSRQYEFTMPDTKTRKLILNILLKTENIHNNINLNDIAQKTQFYSGSDLKELCKYAATLPLKEYVRQRSRSSLSSSPVSNNATPDGSNSNSNSSSWFGFNSSVNNNDIDKDNSQLLNFNPSQQQQQFQLRAIEQNDLLIALKHIKSTMKAHAGHKAKYGRNNNSSLFGMNEYNNMGLFGMNPYKSYSQPHSQQNNNNDKQTDTNVNIDNDDNDDNVNDIADNDDLLE